MQLYRKPEFEIELPESHPLFYPRQEYMVSANGREYYVRKNKSELSISRRINKGNFFDAYKTLSAESKIGEHGYLNFAFNIDRRQFRSDLISMLIYCSFFWVIMAFTGYRVWPIYLIMIILVAVFTLRALKYKPKKWIERFKEDLLSMEVKYH